MNVLVNNVSALLHSGLENSADAVVCAFSIAKLASKRPVRVAHIMWCARSARGRRLG